jgi:hypothetical protein
MSWARERDFKRLLEANAKHLTKEGIDKMVAIALKDMNLVRSWNYVY